MTLVVGTLFRFRDGRAVAPRRAAGDAVPPVSNSALRLALRNVARCRPITDLKASLGKARVAGDFARSIRSRRELLQTLFYATKNSSAEAWAYFQRLSWLQDQGDDASQDELREGLLDGQRAAEATAQDAAWSLMLIVDYAIRRFAEEMKRVDSTSTNPLTIGSDARNGVKLNDAIRALANQARHYHQWAARGGTEIQSDRESRRSMHIIRTLGYDPLDANAAREFLQAIKLNSYVDLEERLLQTARDVLAGEGHALGEVSPAAFSIVAQFHD